MTEKKENRIVRLGVFYDGGFFHHISNYYRYAHPRKQRISIPGLHAFIRQRAAELEGVPVQQARIIDAHFFRGRFSAQQTLAREKLYSERLFDDVLMNEGITAHYMPIQGNTEQGIDVLLSLEALELTILKRYDILVLLAGDSDFIPMVRKVTAQGTRVMLLGWNFEYTDDVGNLRQTTTSIRLVNEATYSVRMQELMSKSGGALDTLFMEQGALPGLDYEEPQLSTVVRTAPESQDLEPETAEAEETAVDTEAHAAVTVEPPVQDTVVYKGIVCSVKEGFGFIKCPEFPNNVFFHYSALTNRDFDTLDEGELVKFGIEQRAKGPVARDVEVQSID